MEGKAEDQREDDMKNHGRYRRKMEGKRERRPKVARRSKEDIR